MTIIHGAFAYLTFYLIFENVAELRESNGMEYIYAGLGLLLWFISIIRSKLWEPKVETVILESIKIKSN